MHISLQSVLTIRQVPTGLVNVNMSEAPSPCQPLCQCHLGTVKAEELHTEEWQREGEPEQKECGLRFLPWGSGARLWILIQCLQEVPFSYDRIISVSHCS